MRNVTKDLHTLNPKHIIDDTFQGYKVVKLIKKKKVIDQIINIRETVEDLKIFKTWIEWFRSKNVPYVITYNKGNYKLWKEFFPEPEKRRKNHVNR